MGDGIGDTEKVPAAQRGRLAGAIGAAGGQRPDYWGVLPQGVRARRGGKKSARRQDDTFLSGKGVI